MIAATTNNATPIHIQSHGFGIDTGGLMSRKVIGSVGCS